MGMARNLASLLNGSGLVSLTSKVTGSLPNDNIAAMAATKLTGQVPDANAPSGSVIQIVAAQKTNRFVTTSDSYVDVTDLSATITPISSSNRILVLTTLHCSHADDNTGHVRLMRNGTQIAMGDTYGSFERTLFSVRIAGGGDSNGVYMTNPYSMQWLDTPNSASALTYKITARARAGSPRFVINSSGFDNTSDNNMGATASSIIVMEIAA
jgi:hypothetical protein